MSKQKNKDKKTKKGVSRREFIRTTATAGTATIAGIAGLKAVQGKAPAEASKGTLPSAPVPAAASHEAGLPVTDADAAWFVSDQELAAGQEFAVRAAFPVGNPGALPHVRTAEEQAFPKFNRQAVLFALGDTLIPSTKGDPGYRDLEWYGITAEVSRRLEELSDEDLAYFNQSSIPGLGKPFDYLAEPKRAEYLRQVLKSGGFSDEAQQKKLKEIYSHARELIFIVYYQNFPEDHWPRDASRVPLLRAGDEHQITNPNTSAVVTGWDVTGYSGPLTWEEEERRRNLFKKIRWDE